MNCPACGQALPPTSRFCIGCGKPVAGPFVTPDRIARTRLEAEDMNLPALYAMAALLILAGLFPPWESQPGHPPEFLGFHFILSGKAVTGGIVSRLLLTIELVTIAVAGLYCAWLLRKKK
ncbi:MAG: zinc ribbon domain-containing protein [Nitrospira sp.]|nr:zinc ribbon domain-containing protein [Nitrospira sp.]